MELRDKIIELLSNVIESDINRIKEISQYHADLCKLYDYPNKKIIEKLEKNGWIEEVRKSGTDEKYIKIKIDWKVEEIIKINSTYMKKRCGRSFDNIFEFESSEYNKKLNLFVESLVETINQKEIKFNLDELKMIITSSPNGSAKYIISDNSCKISFTHLFAWGNVNRPHYRWLIK